LWNQVYDPFGNVVLSTLAAALPIATLLVLIASNKVRAHIAALIALIVANLVAIFFLTMPVGMSLRATVLGAVTGFFPIGWQLLVRKSRSVLTLSRRPAYTPAPRREGWAMHGAIAADRRSASRGGVAQLARAEES
jgi:hypothetical protein